MDDVTVNRNDVICTEFDGGEAVLVDLRSKRYYELNETALVIWHGLEKGLGLDDIVSKVVADYEVTPLAARQSIERLISRLQSYRLVMS
jgi:hypothetical protein